MTVDDVGIGGSPAGIGEFETPPSPDTLGPDGTALWEQISEGFELDVHHLVLLEAACSAFDTLRGAERLLLEAGSPVMQDRFGQDKAHPMVAVARDSRISLARLLRELDLDGQPLPAPRMPRW